MSGGGPRAIPAGGVPAGAAMAEDAHAVASGPARWARARAQAVRWDLPLLIGVLPLLAGGFWASGVANRVPFAGWGLVAALGWFAALRLGLKRGWSRGRRAGAQLLIAAAALAALAPLLVRDGAALDSGLRAVAPTLAPAVPGPAAAAGLAALCALAGAGLLVSSRAGTRRPEASR